MNIYHIPENEQPLDELYAVISTDNNGEGIVSIMLPECAMPLVFGHKKNIESLRPIIEDISRKTGKKLLLVRYKKSEILEEFS